MLPTTVLPPMYQLRTSGLWVGRVGLVRVQEPAVEPLTVAELRPWLRLADDDDSQDGVTAALVASVRARFERVALRALLPQRWRLSLECFPVSAVIALPRPPLVAVVSVTYLDPAGVRQTADTSLYVAEPDGEPATVRPAVGCFWPPHLAAPGSVQVTYDAGYASPAAVPAEYRERLKVALSYQFHNREAQDEDYLDGLFAAYRVPWGC